MAETTVMRVRELRSGAYWVPYEFAETVRSAGIPLRSRALGSEPGLEIEQFELGMLAPALDAPMVLVPRNCQACNKRGKRERVAE